MITEEFKKNLKEKYGIVFHNEKLLERAFTHTSYENEHPGSGNYEKLDFLGDAVLDYLYRHFPKLNEGELTRLRSNIVRTEGFSEFAKEAGFANIVNLGKGEEKSGARQRKTLLEDIFEAFNGALFLDQGLPAVQHFLHLTVYPLIAEGDFDDSRDYKTELQERLQKNGPVKIKYKVIEEDEAKPMFKVQLVVNGVAKTQGTGRNKKSAEQQAAKKELQNI